MGRSQETFGKKEREKKRLKKRKEKEARKLERKENSKKGTGLDNMISYVDEYGNITDTPPDPNRKKEEVDASSIQLGVPKREKEEINPNRKGRLDFFNEDKGYGFIKDSENQEKYFVHFSSFLDDIQQGDKVKFELEKGPKGMNAVRVKLQ